MRFKTEKPIKTVTNLTRLPEFWHLGITLVEGSQALRWESHG